MDPVPARELPPRAYPEDPYADPRLGAWRLEGLRTALTVVGLLALIAIGVAVWALIRADHNDNGRRTIVAPANAAAVASLERRVNNLAATVHSLSIAKGTRVANAQSLASQITALQASQKALAAKVGHGGASPAQVSQLASKEAALSAKVSQWVGKEAALSGQVSGLQGKVGQLSGQIAQLESQVNGQTRTGTGTTTTGG
jgi:outer membrane murein-binding lipoprotein Lpp